MSQIAIITRTGLPQGDRILSGVYGKLVKEAGEHGPGTFRIAPEFLRVSPLFGLLNSREAPVSLSGHQVLEVPDALELDMQSYLMHSLGVRWQKMYQEMNSHVDVLLKTMLTNDAANVAAGARGHLVSMGMRAYTVPLVCKARVEVYELPEMSDRALMKRAALNASSIVIDAQAEVIDVGMGMLGEAPVQPVASQGEIQEQVVATPPPAWADAMGVDVTFKASVVMVARDAERARQMAAWWAARSADPQNMLRMELQPEELVQVERLALAEGEDNADGDDEDGLNDGSYRRWRDSL